VTIERPTYVRIEYWSAEKADWWVGHGGMQLMNPEKYITGVTDKGKIIARAVVVDTGEVIYPTGYGADLL